MKIISKIVAVIAVITALLVLFIGACALNPGLSDRLGAFLRSHGFTQTSSAIPSGSADTIISVDIPSAASAAVSTEAVPISEDTVAGLAVVSGNSGYRKYSVPSENALIIPSAVAGKNGFVPVNGQGEQVTDTAAQKMRVSVGIGETGDGLTFDETEYPYYAMLDTGTRKLYCQIYANMNALTKSFSPVTDTSAGSLKNAFTAVCNDHPELFWVNTAYMYQYGGSGHIAVIDLSYNSTAADLNSSKQKFDAAAASLLSAADNAATDADKELAIHDALLAHDSYDRNSDMNQSAYSSVVNGSTVCAGYAKAFQYLMQQLDVTCYYCTGYSGENHAWDIISLDDGYYNVDTTWDNSDPATYDYYNCTDAEFSTTHIRRDLAVNLPPCNGTKYAVKLSTAPSGNTAGGSGQRTLADAGFAESDVISDINSYYSGCLAGLEATADNPAEYKCVISDKNLLDDISKAYNDNSYRSAYGEKLLTDRSASGMSVEVTAEPLDGGYYLLTHTATFR